MVAQALSPALSESRDFCRGLLNNSGFPGTTVVGRVGAGAGIALADAAAAVNEDLVEAAPVGLVRGGVAQVPPA